MVVLSETKGPPFKGSLIHSFSKYLLNNQYLWKQYSGDLNNPYPQRPQHLVGRIAYFKNVNQWTDCVQYYEKQNRVQEKNITGALIR